MATNPLNAVGVEYYRSATRSGWLVEINIIIFLISLSFLVNLINPTLFLPFLLMEPIMGAIKSQHPVRAAFVYGYQTAARQLPAEISVHAAEPLQSLWPQIIFRLGENLLCTSPLATLACFGFYTQSFLLLVRD